MELKPGYRETEIGPLPNDWDVDVIDNIAAITTGSCNTQDRIEDGEFPFFVRSQTVERINSYSFDGEAVLTAGDGVGTGKVFHYINGKFDVHQRVYRISDFSSRVNGYFFYLYFSRQFYNRIMQMTAKSSVDSVRRDMIAQMMIPVPQQVEEQEAIARAIRDVDGLMEALDRLIGKKRDLKQAAMQQLLTGDTRLPGFTGEWEPRRLGDVGKCLRGVSYRGDSDLSTHDTINTKRLLRSNNIQNAIVVTEEVQFVNCARVSAVQILKADDILICMANGTKALVGKAGLFRVIDGYEYTFGAFMGCFRTDSAEANPAFVFHLLLTGRYRDCINNLLAGSSINNLRPTSIESLEFPMPTLPEQTAISQALSDMDAELEVLQQRRTKTANLKQAMMQELLTGRIRLVEPQHSKSEDTSAAQNDKGHNWAINEAVVIATLVKHFGSEDFPLGRKRYTKLSYLLHRHVERKAEGYLKKAAGPYNPQTKYGGPEKIAKRNGYIREYKGPRGHSGFVAADNMAQAEAYFEKWYGPEVINWLNQFRFSKNDELEVLATVDMAVYELRSSGGRADVAAVTEVIRSHPEWKAKLDRPVFSKSSIAEAINKSEELFATEVSRGAHA